MIPTFTQIYSVSFSSYKLSIFRAKSKRWKVAVVKMKSLFVWLFPTHPKVKKTSQVLHIQINDIPHARLNTTENDKIIGAVSWAYGVTCCYTPIVWLSRFRIGLHKMERVWNPDSPSLWKKRNSIVCHEVIQYSKCNPILKNAIQYSKCNPILKMQHNLI